MKSTFVFVWVFAAASLFLSEVISCCSKSADSTSAAGFLTHVRGPEGSALFWFPGRHSGSRLLTLVQDGTSGAAFVDSDVNPDQVQFGSGPTETRSWRRKWGGGGGVRSQQTKTGGRRLHGGVVMLRRACKHKAPVFAEGRRL